MSTFVRVLAAGISIGDGKARACNLHWRGKPFYVMLPDLSSSNPAPSASRHAGVHTGCRGLRQRCNRCPYRLERDYSDRYSDSSKSLYKSNLCGTDAKKPALIAIRTGLVGRVVRGKVWAPPHL